MVIVHELNETWEKSRRSCNTNDADSINIGNGFLWIATDGKVYVKAGATAPTGDTDGTIIGTQTA